MKKADVAEHPKVFRHVGLLFNEPSGRTSLLFIQSSGEFRAPKAKFWCFDRIPTLKVTMLAVRAIARSLERSYTVTLPVVTMKPQRRDLSAIPPLATMSTAARSSARNTV